ncbi:hypothetical protein ILYODFUR_016778 [Ilyodon furcidens]|uniref:Uncharacterized protein n=1 Tax=Ilyodon furcidens TaxID=33524 RepID=A0ABV0TLS6_9TELE
MQKTANKTTEKLHECPCISVHMPKLTHLSDCAPAGSAIYFTWVLTSFFLLLLSFSTSSLFHSLIFFPAWYPPSISLPPVRESFDCTQWQITYVPSSGYLPIGQTI